MRYLRAAGLRATDKCVDVVPACPVSISADGTPSSTTTKRIPDLITGATTAYDVMVTHASGATDAATRPLHAAGASEAHKNCKSKWAYPALPSVPLSRDGAADGVVRFGSAPREDGTTCGRVGAACEG